MSRENVEVVRRVLAAISRRDLSYLAEAADPEVEWQGLIAGLEGGIYRGHEGARRWLTVTSPDRVLLPGDAPGIPSPFAVIGSL